MPSHVAVVMDGNGRWAKKRGLLRVKGHRKGVDAVRSTVTASAALGIEWLTLYAFSTENWQRPQREVDYLMELLGQFLREELQTLLDNDVRLQVIGQPERLQAAVRELLEQTIDQTKHCQGTILSLALSYGGRDELLEATRRIAQAVADGSLPVCEIDHQTIQNHLYAPQAPDVDVVMRTAGEQRLSNFLPWQSVYAEYVAIDVLWPEVTEAHYHAALKTYQARHRRFGKV
jgi:undecaprenyl diphosphate synthase